jgi:archaellum component FlaD/FlaE
VDGHRPDARSPGESETYLSTLPPTYAAESVAMEWMRYLVSVGGPLGASRALREYEEFGWISAEVRATLDTYVRLAASPGDDAYNGPLSVGHHETSLTYVSRLGTREPDATALGTLVADGGGHDGLRR